MRKIAEHIAGACRAGGPLVLVAVAESKDSTPRKAGTLMLVSADGLACGTIGGGAIEAHGIACARRLLGGKAHRFENMGLEGRFGHGLRRKRKLAVCPDMRRQRGVGQGRQRDCCAVSRSACRRIWR